MSSDSVLGSKLSGCALIFLFALCGCKTVGGLVKTVPDVVRTLGETAGSALGGIESGAKKVSDKIDPDVRKIKRAVAIEARRIRRIEYDVVSLNLSGLNLKRIGHLRKMPNLRSLDLSENSITDLSALSEAHKLSVLILDGNNELTDEEILTLRRRLPGCTILYNLFEGLDFASVAPSKKLLKQFFSPFGNGRSDRLKLLQLVSDQIKKDSKVIVDKDLSVIYKLDVSDTDISELDAIQALGNLKVLDISRTPVSSLKPLDDLGLRLLVAQGNELLDRAELVRFSGRNPKCFVVHPVIITKDAPANPRPFPPVERKARPPLQGKVALVDQALGFIVADFTNLQLPPAKQKFFVYRVNQKVGEVITTAQNDGAFLVADIEKGEIRTGDYLTPPR